MFELPSRPVLNHCRPGPSDDPPYTPLALSAQKSPAMNPALETSRVDTSPGAVQALFMTMPGGAMVIQYAFCPLGTVLAPTFSICIRHPSRGKYTERSP